MLQAGAAESIGAAGSRMHAKDAQGTALRCAAASVADPQAAMRGIAGLLADSGLPPPDAIGHRIVHGGARLRQHCLIDETVLRLIGEASAFAPLHTPAVLSAIRFAQACFPGVPQVACFDTQFHADLPDIAQTLPLPRALQRDGLRRYGFHGLSCESILHQLRSEFPDGIPDRVVIAHLGSGASVSAVKAGASLDTSMGLTPTGGVMMSTRSGDLDPGVLVYLMREKNYDAARLEALVDHESGLLGVSGISGDLRLLHEAGATDTGAALAIRMFCQSVLKQVAAMIAVLGGIDLIVFTGGIGEHDAAVRAAICAGLAWIGIGLDDARNRAATNPLSSVASRCPVYVLAAQEEVQIARIAFGLV